MWQLLAAAIAPYVAGNLITESEDPLGTDTNVNNDNNH
jgi:hypothetical protein